MNVTYKLTQNLQCMSPYISSEITYFFIGFLLLLLHDPHAVTDNLVILRCSKKTVF